MFKNLSTVKFAKRMRPAAQAVLETIFKAPAQYLDGTAQDREQGIDVMVGQVTIQEKIRTSKFLKSYGPELCIETKNGNGTPAEWEYIAADYYLLGYASEDEMVLDWWAIIDVARVKALVAAQGFEALGGKTKQNNQHGKAVFVAIPVDRIKDAVVWCSTDAEDTRAELSKRADENIAAARKTVAAIRETLEIE